MDLGGAISPSHASAELGLWRRHAIEEAFGLGGVGSRFGFTAGSGRAFWPSAMLGDPDVMAGPFNSGVFYTGGAYHLQLEVPQADPDRRLSFVAGAGLTLVVSHGALEENHPHYDLSARWDFRAREPVGGFLAVGVQSVLLVPAPVMSAGMRF